MNIGITIDTSISPKNSDKNQAIILMADVLSRSGHKCFLVTNRRINPNRSNRAGAEILKAGHFIARFDPTERDPLKLDVCIEAGFQYEPSTAAALKEKNPKCKFIHFCLENQTVIDSAASMTDSLSGPPRLKRQFDEVWTWSFLAKTKDYLEATFCCKARLLPFIWDSKFIANEVFELKKRGKSPFYNPSRDNTVCIFEENKHAHATCIVPLAICEILNQKNPKIIKKISVTNCESLKKNKHFSELTANLSIHKEKEKTFFNNSWNNIHALSRWGKSIIFYNSEGELTGKHLEALHLGFPMIHNAEEIKEYAYYYETEGLENAANQLSYSLTVHAENQDYYKGQATECIRLFSPASQKNIEAYNSAVKKTLSV